MRRNAEIAHSWFRVAIRNDYAPAYPQLARYLTSIGRRKLVRPLYEDLMKTPRGADLARSIYAQARAGLPSDHPDLDRCDRNTEALNRIPCRN